MLETKSKNIARFTYILAMLLPALAWASDASGHSSDAGHNMTHRMMMLAIQFGLIIFAAKLGNIIFERFKMPGVLGELFAGMAVGAYALGGISLPGFPEGIFPIFQGGPISPELYGISTIASIVLLFDVGLETDLKLLIRYFFAGSMVGIGGVIFSFGLGMVVAYYYGPSLGYNPSSLFDPMCMFMGIASTATSVGITARILSEKRKLDSPEGVTILSAAVIDDVIGIIMLAIVTGISAAKTVGGGETDWGHIAVIGVKAVSVWLIATFVGIMASKHISFLLKMFRDRSSIANMAFGLALLLAGFFEEAGLAMIIGAYVMGLSLSRSDISHVVREKLHPIYQLTVPVFFCVTGMMIDLNAMTDKSVLIFGAVYTVTALIAKVIGCGLPALIANFNVRGALRVGFGMAPRGEVGLIIATLGLAAGVLNNKLFAAVIIMVVINTVLAPPVLVALFKNPARGTRKEMVEDAEEKELLFSFAGFHMVEFFITKLSTVFEAEGFFVHLVSRPDRLYQVRKDSSVIEFQHCENELKFFCAERDVRFVHQAMLEATASLEHALKSLRKPLDSNEFHNGMSEATVSNPKTQKLMQYLRPEFVCADLKATDKPGIINELSEILVKSGQLPKNLRESSVNAVLEREESMSTGFPGGLAIPHAKIKGINKIICAIGIKSDGVEFKAMDNNPSTVFVMTLSPTDKPAPHVEFLAAVTGVLQTKGIDNIAQSKSSGELYNKLSS